MVAIPQDFPSEFETDVVLRDGSTVHVRPVREDDEPALTEFFRGISINSMALRFFSAGTSAGVAARIATEVDYSGRFGLVATGGTPTAIVGHAMYTAADEETVEVAFILPEAMQGRGLGTVLLAHLAAAAESRGYHTMVAEVLPQNARMLDVMRQSGFPFEISSQPGSVRAVSPVSLSSAGITTFEARDHASAVAAVRHPLQPATGAAGGASSVPAPGRGGLL